MTDQLCPDCNTLLTGLNLGACANVVPGCKRLERTFSMLSGPERQLLTCALAGNHPPFLGPLRMPVLRALARADGLQRRSDTPAITERLIVLNDDSLICERCWEDIKSSETAPGVPHGRTSHGTCKRCGGECLIGRYRPDPEMPE